MSNAHRPIPGRPILRALLLSLLLVSSACSEADSSASDAKSKKSSGADDEATARPASVARPHAEGETAPRHSHERPIPAFEGTTTAGARISIRDLLGSRIVLFLFNPDVAPSADISKAVSAVAAESGSANFKVLGVGVGSDPNTLGRFVERNGIEFPVIDDSAGSITSLLRLRMPNAILGIDPDGYLGFAMPSFPTEGDVAGSVEAELRSNLRLPARAGAATPGALYAYPAAPELGVIGMSDGETVEIADLSGRAAIVIFFLHTCPHCHRALAAIQPMLESIPEDKRPRLIAISIQNRPAAIRASMKEQRLEYFQPYLDPEQKATERWGVTGGVPVVLIVDGEGRIRHRSIGWNDQRDPGIVRMKVAKAAGARVPMLLDPKGYSGNDVCGVCHEKEYATWQYTAHATAFDTLVTHAADRRTDCVGCHVVGFEQPGGYDFERKQPHLEDVGCESCHGRGGPHLSPSFLPKTADGKIGYETVCATCHNPTHSLGFEFATFRPRISHERIAAMSNAERAKLLGGAGPDRELLPTQAAYVGSAACQSCHTKEFETWQASPHGHAIESLEAKNKTGDPSCLACHTTAYGKEGGFPSNASVADHPDLARVGCESCHGPGGDHIGKSAKRVGTILSLGDKCDSCVILKICGSCHDDANDPGFEFRVEERIEEQRHGTIEAAATRGDDSADRVRLREAFERLAADDADRGAHGSTDRAAAGSEARRPDPS